MITTILEVRQYVSMMNDLSFDRLSPLICGTKTKYFEGWAGTALINQILGFKMAPDPIELEGYEKLISGFCNALIFEYTPFGEVLIGNSGITRTENQNVKTAFAGQIKNLNESLQDTAFKQIESLIELMYANPTKFPLWALAPGYVSPANATMLPGRASEYAKYQAMHRPNITFTALTPEIIKVQDLYLVANFGSALVKEMCTNTADLSQVKADLKAFMMKALICFVNHKVLSNGSFTLGPEGLRVIEHTSATSYVPSKSINGNGISAYNYERDGYLFIEQAKKFILDNASDFPTNQETIQEPDKFWV